MTTRSAEGGIEWRGKDCATDGHRHSNCPFRVRVAARGKYIYATGRGNVKAANVALRQLLDQRDGGLDASPRKLTVSQWMQAWLEGRIADGAIGPRAAENYRTILARRLIPAVGDLRLQELRADHVLDLKTTMLAQPLAPATVRKQLGLLRQGLDAAVVAGLIPRNPADPVPSPSVVNTSRERRALDEGEIVALVRAASGTPYDTPIRLALATGMRQAEALGLTWDSINFERGVLLVERTLSYVGGELVMLPPKTRNSRRTIELSPATVAMLKRHRTAQNEERLRLGPIWQDHGLVLPSPDGSPQYRQAFLRGFRRVVDASGIAEPEAVNWHSLRHTAASQWIGAGVDIFTVSRRLGHAKAGFTMDVYGHLVSGQQRTAAEALDHLLAATATP